jgi:hypothetical protein
LFFINCSKLLSKHLPLPCSKKQNFCTFTHSDQGKTFSSLRVISGPPSYCGGDRGVSADRSGTATVLSPALLLEMREEPRGQTNQSTKTTKSPLHAEREDFDINVFTVYFIVIYFYMCTDFPDI